MTGTDLRIYLLLFVSIACNVAVFVYRLDKTQRADGAPPVQCTECN